MNILHRLPTIYPDFLHRVRWEPLGNAGGFSGATICRGLEGDIRRWCLRIAPLDFPANQLRFAQQLMKVARNAGLAIVPSIYPTRTGEGFFLDPASKRHVELMDWMPGQADFHRNPTDSRLLAAVEALAELHRAIRPEIQTFANCPGILRRMTVLETPTQSPPVASSLVTRAIRLLDGLRPTALQILRVWNEERFSLQPCVCDIRDDHVLYEGDRVSGIIDYSAAKLDHIAVDLARLLGSMVPDDEGRMKLALDHYQRINGTDTPLSDLVRMLDWTGTLAAIQVGVGRLSHLHDEAAIAYEDRLRTLIDRMERRSDPW